MERKQWFPTPFTPFTLLYTEFSNMSVRNPLHKMALPTEDSIVRGAKFTCCIDNGADGHTGKVYDVHGGVCWQFGVRKNDFGRSWGNPFNKKDFVVYDSQTGIENVIRRVSFLPSRFTITDARGVQGTLSMISILRNKYAIKLKAAHSLWIFRMPLFRVCFWGEADQLPGLWVRETTKTTWEILMSPELDYQPLIAALSFIHVERWNYS